MAINNASVVPILWEARILAALERMSTFRALCDTSWDVLIDGDRVRIPTVTVSGTVGDYVPGTTTVTYTAPDATAKDIIIAKNKWWSTKVDDIHAVQSRANLLDEAVRLSGLQLAKQVDEDVKAEFDTTSNTITAITESSSTATTDFAKVLTLAHLELDKNRVPREGRFVVMSPYGYMRLLRWQAIASSAGSTGYSILNQNIQEGVIRSGQVGSAYGFNLFVYDADMATVSGTGNAMNSVETWYFGHSMSVGYIDQVNQTEALRLEGQFASAVRGLYTYGYDVLRPEALFKQAMTLYAINA